MGGEEDQNTLITTEEVEKGNGIKKERLTIHKNKVAIWLTAE